MTKKPKPKIWIDSDDEGAPSTPEITIYDSDPAPLESGLLDASGNKLVRKIGFDLTTKKDR